MDRRTFAKVAGGALAGAPVAAQQEFAWPASKKMIGIQVGAVSFVDEGVDPLFGTAEAGDRILAIGCKDQHLVELR